jgi:hypothetical protein
VRNTSGGAVGKLGIGLPKAGSMFDDFGTLNMKRIEKWEVVFKKGGFEHCFLGKEVVLNFDADLVAL